ncbi:MAG: ParM/StbA family protein [Chloroflexota bacterium]|nr:ParM/StbA family protein [Chloroflexota bacterium]
MNVEMPKQAHIISSVGVGKTNLGNLSLGRFSQGHERKLPLTIKWGESSYLVGEHVSDYARPLERLDFQRLSEGAEQRALTYATLGKLFGPGSHTIDLMVVGLPVEVQEDADLSERVKRQLKSWLEGSHNFSLDEQDIQIHIKRIGTMAQPAGTFFAWGLSNQGNWTRSQADYNGLTGICDVGFNTLDLFTSQRGAIQFRYTGGDTAGTRRAVEQLGATLENNYGVNYSLHELDAMLRKGNVTLNIAQGQFDISEAILEAKNSAAGNILTFIEKKWGNGNQFANTLFTGGGAMMFREQLTAEYPQANILPEPVTANALGLARYARMLVDLGLVVGQDAGFGGFKAVALMAN